MDENNGTFRMGDITLLYRVLVKNIPLDLIIFSTHAFGEHPTPYISTFNVTNEDVYKLDVYAKTIETILN